MRARDFDKQQRIKEAMVSIILRDGINGASIAKIAKEAEVSPATIYVYYSNKEEMLSEVFKEYSSQSYTYLMNRIQPGMSGKALIESIVRGYFSYTVDHEEVFSFVEQCSRCPTLSSNVSEEECCCEIFERIHAYQLRGEMRPFSDLGLSAVLFAPIRFLALKQGACQEDTGAALSEFIAMMQHLLLY